MKLYKIKSILATALLSSTLLAGTATAGSIVLTGHDILSHSNQNGYNLVILDYLRGAGTTSEILRANYTVGKLSTGFADPTQGGVFAGSLSQNVGSFGTAAVFSTFLGTVDALVLPELGSGDMATLASAPYKTAIEAFFNAGGDIWADTNNNQANYYNFLPPGAAASAAGINQSTGFAPTAAGAAIGITSAMVNGNPTHNIFPTFSNAFTVLEVRSSDQTALTIGARDVTFGGGGIVTGVSEPSALMFLGLGVAGIGFARRRRTR